MHRGRGFLGREEVGEEVSHAGEGRRFGEVFCLLGSLFGAIFLVRDGEFGPLVEDPAGLNGSVSVPVLWLSGRVDRVDNHIPLAPDGLGAGP